MHRRSGTSCRSGFTMVELVVVIVIIGILGAVGAMRYFDNTAFASRAVADQVKSLMRFAQKLAIAQNREIYVMSGPSGFSVCSSNNCAAGTLATHPANSNNGTSATRAFCTSGGAYVASWACLGIPSDTVVNVIAARNEFGPSGYFYFDALGRPHNKGDAVGGTSTFTNSMTLNFTSGSNVYSLVIEPETGYVH